MPFDGRQPCLEIQIIDKALEVLGPKGEHWLQGKRSDRRGNRCVMGAVDHARRSMGIKKDRTISFLLKAAGYHHRVPARWYVMEDFNDDPKRTFDEIAALLVQARTLAASQC
jgi:hypothetical protein